MLRHALPLLIVFWVFAWHGRALTGYFYGDDWFQITPRSATTVAKSFAGDWNEGRRGEGGFFRPMVRVSFALDRAVWGDSPRGYHLTGLLLLAVNAVLLWGLTRRLLHEEALAVAAALGFVLLPAQAEVAWWVSTRGDLLAAIGVLGALVLWSHPLKAHLPFARLSLLRRHHAPRHLPTETPPAASANRGNAPPPPPIWRTHNAAAWGMLVFGLLSKEIAVAGLVLLPLLDWIWRKREFDEATSTAAQGLAASRRSHPEAPVTDPAAARRADTPAPTPGTTDDLAPDGDPRVVRLRRRKLLDQRFDPLGNSGLRRTGAEDEAPEGATATDRDAPPPAAATAWRCLWRPWLRRTLLPAIALGGVYLAWRTFALGGIGGYLAAESEPMTLRRIWDTYRIFLSGLVWPPGSGGAYGAHWKAWAAIFGGGLLLSRGRGGLVFAVAGVLATVAPMAGLGLTPEAGGRFMLLPGAFGMLAWAALVPSAIRRMSRPFRWTPACFLLLMSLLWSPALLNAAERWNAATAPNRRAFEETWRFVESLDAESPGRIGIVTGPIPGGYHVWAAGDAMPVALHAQALARGWRAEWGDIEAPYPAPIVLHRPDGGVVRAWIGVPPDLAPGATILEIDAEGRAHPHTVVAVERPTWDAAAMADWSVRGPGRLRLSGDARTAEDPSPETLACVLDGPGVWIGPFGREEGEEVDGADGAGGAGGSDGADGGKGQKGQKGQKGRDGVDGANGVGGSDGVGGADGVGGSDQSDRSDAPSSDNAPQPRAAPSSDNAPQPHSEPSAHSASAALPSAAARRRYVVVELTGVWSRPGVATLEAVAAFDSPGTRGSALAPHAVSHPRALPDPVRVPVPPRPPHRTTHAQGGWWDSWPVALRLSPLDRSGHVALDRMRLIVYTTTPAAAELPP